MCAQSCPTLCKPMDCNLPGSSVHGILQARLLAWVAIPFSRGPSKSMFPASAHRFFSTKPPGKPVISTGRSKEMERSHDDSCGLGLADKWSGPEETRSSQKGFSQNLKLIECLRSSESPGGRLGQLVKSLRLNQQKDKKSREEKKKKNTVNSKKNKTLHRKGTVIMIYYMAQLQIALTLS